MAIKVETWVNVSEDAPKTFGMFKDRAGKVARIYDDLIIPVAIVEFSENVTAKIPIGYLIEIKDQAKEPDPEIPEGVKQITRDDFTRAIIDATCSKFTGKMSDLYGSASAALVGMDIAEKLFKDRDVVDMTKDQLAATLWDGCSPTNVSDTVGGSMELIKSMSVSIASVIILRSIVDILFPESEND